jgi:uncharacterized protein (TIGR03067 family)
MSKLRPAIFVALFVLLSPAWLDAEQEKEGKAEAIKAELKKLEGRWIVTKQEVLGKESIPKKLVVVIQDGRLSYYSGDLGRPTSVNRIELDPTKSPKEMDLVVVDGLVAKKGSTALAIYRFNEAGDLEICHPAPNDKNPKRPTAFTTKPGVGSGGNYRVMKRDATEVVQKKDGKTDKIDKADKVDTSKAEPEKGPAEGLEGVCGRIQKGSLCCLAANERQDRRNGKSDNWQAIWTNPDFSDGLSSKRWIHVRRRSNQLAAPTCQGADQGSAGIFP